MSSDGQETLLNICCSVVMQTVESSLDLLVSVNKMQYLLCVLPVTTVCGKS